MCKVQRAKGAHAPWGYRQALDDVKESKKDQAQTTNRREPPCPSSRREGKQDILTWESRSREDGEGHVEVSSETVPDGISTACPQPFSG